MPVRGKRPELFKNGNYRKVGRRTIDGMRSEILDNLQATAMRVDNVVVKRMPTYLQVTERKLESQGVVDLKKAFVQSSKKKRSLDGGWYMVIPIRIKTSRMNRKTYQDMRSLPIQGEKGVANAYTDYLVGKRKPVSHPALHPEPMTHRMTKIKNGRKSSYFIFRTVSSKSPANSWILNRDKVTEENFSKTTMKTVRQLMNWKMKNL